MVRRPTRPEPLRGQVFRGSTAKRSGLLTREQLSGAAWRHLFHDVYADARLRPDHLLYARGAALLLPAGAVVTGRSAAHVWGVAMARDVDPVEIWSPTRFGPFRGLKIHVSPTIARCTTVHRGVPVCTAPHAAWEIARSLPVLDAVEWIDALGRRRRLSRTDLLEHGVPHQTRRGARHAEATLRLVDPAAESPPESRIRAAFALAGLPRPVPQFVVLDRDGYFLGRVDLAWPQLRFAVEYDGQWHADRDQLTRDRRRLRALVAAGWEIYHATRDDLRDLDRLVREVAAAVERRAVAC